MAWFLVFVVFAVLLPDTFLSTASISNILGSQAVPLVLTLSLVLPLVCGDYDMSVASVATLTAMVIGILNVNHGWSIGAAIVAGLVVALLAGLVNGAVIVFFGVDSLIVTLGTGTVIQGLVLWISNSTTISGISSSLVDLVIGYKLVSVPAAFYYGLALCFVLWYLLQHTALGMRMLFVGRGRDVARLSGIKVGRVRMGALVSSAGLAGVAGTLYAGTTGSADPSSGTSFLLPAFAAVFLGATTVIPGRFNAWGAFIAVYFLATGITGLQLLGAESFVQQLFYGGALVIAVSLAQLARRREARSGGTAS
ncbi:ABC transporter permease [Nocardioides sp. T5]|uniref:ABC transporter permease n=1 Tax=Nocardioides sp. T5 TaxID=3400182 RepID=UPI003A886673